MLSPNEWTVLAISGMLVLAAGWWHLMGIRAIMQINQRLPGSDNRAVLIAFWGLAILHFSEIVVGACSYGMAIYWLGLGTISGGYGDTPAGLLYFSGITFTSLGYAPDQTVSGPLHLMVMMQSLAGFMLITWSATYVYTIWGERFRRQG